MTTYYIIAFESTHYAIKTEKMLMKDFKIEMIPTPREISASCGLSIKAEPDEIDDIIKLIQAESFQGIKMFKLSIDGDNQRRADELNWRG